MTRAPLFQRHGERVRDRRCHRLRIVGVDEKRRRAFGRRPGKARQDEDARILGILGGDIFLRHEVHAVAQWRDQPHACGTVESRQRAAGCRRD